MVVKGMRNFMMSAALLLTAAPAFAQDSSWAEKMFEKTSHDFGVVARGADTRYRIAIKNIYKPTVHIASVQTSCGCTAAQPSKDTLASHETAYIEVTMNTVRFENQKNSSITVVFDSPQYAEVRIPISAFIRTDLVLTPGSVQFGPMTRGMEQPRKVSITYAGGHDWRIKDLAPQNPRFNIKVVETSRQAGHVNYDVTVSVKPGTGVGDLREQLTLATNDPSRPQLPLLIEGRIEPEYTISPDIVSFGTLRPGEKKTVNVVVRGKKPFSIEKVESPKAPGTFEVKTTTEPKTVHVLPVTVVAPTEPGTLNEQLDLVIAGHKDHYHFKAYGKISAPTATQHSAAKPTEPPAGETIGVIGSKK